GTTSLPRSSFVLNNTFHRLECSAFFGRDLNRKTFDHLTIRGSAHSKDAGSFNFDRGHNKIDPYSVRCIGRAVRTIGK
ncbi:hypothetical protein, partial [Mycobacterium tuberculosis]|uniref:hypothetical protein n=1 Tax=Mycobacterium tuberculosis TaxID=1773 RepID=UPI00207A334F